MKLFIIRHGEPNYALDCLTEAGHEQAKKVAERFKDLKIDRLYSSTHGRALLTASYTAKLHHKRIIKAEWAKEDKGWAYFNTNGRWCFFDEELKPYFQSEHLKALGNDWYKDPKIQETKIPEGIEIMRKDSDEFLLSLGYKHNRDKHIYYHVGKSPNVVFLFAHGGFAFSFLSAILEEPYNTFTTERHDLYFTAVVEVDFDDGDCFPKMVMYNDYSHLKDEK